MKKYFSSCKKIGMRTNEYGYLDFKIMLHKVTKVQFPTNINHNFPLQKYFDTSFSTSNHSEKIIKESDIILFHSIPTEVITHHPIHHMRVYNIH